MRDCTICVAKTKALINCAVTAQLICTFVFALAKIQFSHDRAHIRAWDHCLIDFRMELQHGDNFKLQSFLSLSITCEAILGYFHEMISFVQ